MATRADVEDSIDTRIIDLGADAETTDEDSDSRIATTTTMHDMLRTSQGHIYMYRMYYRIYVYSMCIAYICMQPPSEGGLKLGTGEDL